MAIIKEAPARIINVSVNAVNQNKQLLRPIITLPDRDIIKHIGRVSSGICEILEKLMKWNINVMYRLIGMRKDDLTRYCAEAISFGENKLIHVQCPTPGNVQFFFKMKHVWSGSRVLESFLNVFLF